MKLRSLIAPLPAIHLVVIRWGNDADKTSDDEKKFPVLQGPMRMDLLRFE